MFNRMSLCFEVLKQFAVVVKFICCFWLMLVPLFLIFIFAVKKIQVPVFAWNNIITYW